MKFSRSRAMRIPGAPPPARSCQLRGMPGSQVSVHLPFARGQTGVPAVLRLAIHRLEIRRGSCPAGLAARRRVDNR